MSSLALEVDEVLEQEFASMYCDGPTSEQFSEDDIRDAARVRALPGACPIRADDVCATANRLVGGNTAPEVSSSPAMTERARGLLDSYEQDTKATSMIRKASRRHARRRSTAELSPKHSRMQLREVPSNHSAEDNILDPVWARAILSACHIPADDGLLLTLDRVVVGDAPRVYAGSTLLEHCGGLL